MDSCPTELECERYLNGAATGAVAAAVEAHRDGCARCRAWFERARNDDDLLGSLREAWLESRAEAPTDAGDPESDLDAAALGRYALGPVIGTGGMGVVYEAEQRSPRRRVALKVVRPGFSSDQLLRRFEFEAEVLGRLDHPGIARIHEAGTLGSGAGRRPFFAMEFVEGVPLDRFVAEHAPSLEQRLRLFVLICQAVEHAHTKGVVHRDLKPANILVTADGRPKILDFGVARVTDEDLRHASLETRVGQVVGTLAYMSPEQIAGRTDEVDTRSDVYSLGVIFYELLGHRRPFELTDVPLTEAARIVAEVDAAPLGSIRPMLRGDLETIGRKALEKQAERRYGSAGDFAADVQRFLDREPIAARPPGTVYQLVRFSQRHRALVGAAGAVFLAIVAGLVVALVLKEQSDRNAELARVERNNVFSLSAFVQLEKLQAEADALWPIRPEMAGEFRAWLDRAGALVENLESDPVSGAPGHKALRDALRARASEVVEDESGWRTYRFESDEDRWWHEQLERLCRAIEAFDDPGEGLVAGISPRFGWGVERRLEWAETIVERSLEGEREARLWSEAIDSIARSAPYGGLALEPQLGLVPIGADPDSGLWEFVHVQSGATPERNDEGRLAVAEDTGIVLILMPGGTFLMGAQSEDPSAPGYCEYALVNETPVREVELTPYFISKYEMTQGQWLRLAGDNPAGGRPGSSRVDPFDLRHPVETVSWPDSERTLTRVGLCLPTEAQWEFSARAGTATAWFVGADKRALGRVANLADQSCRRSTGAVSWVYEDWDDGYWCHAPVGSFEPNAFGLHDTLGNLWEWCRDGHGYEGYSDLPRVDPVAPRRLTGSAAARGASWNDPAAAARASIRNSGKSDYTGQTMGLRPARELDR